MIKLLVFDMAGTTIDEQNVVYKTLQSSINEFGYPASLEEVLAKGAGMEKYDAIQYIVREAFDPDVEDKKLENIFDHFKKNLKANYKDLKVQEQNGAYATLHELKKKGKLIALNTGYNKKTAKSLLKKLEWKKGKAYHALVTASDVENSRPAPDMIFKVMDRLNIKDAKEVAKIGDSCIDISEGRNAGCGLCIGITSGAQTREQLSAVNPDFIIDDLSELLRLVP
jgi:phosphonatase-like hydrolase